MAGPENRPTRVVAMLRHFPTLHDLSQTFTPIGAEVPFAPIEPPSLSRIAAEIDAANEKFGIETAIFADNPRGKGTWDVIAPLLNRSIKAVADSRLNNIMQPEWSGKTKAEVRGTPLYASWHNNPLSIRFADGETLGDVAVRTSNLLETVPSSCLLISHTTPLQVVTCRLLGFDISRIWSFKFDHLRFSAVWNGILLRYNAESISDIALDEVAL